VRIPDWLYDAEPFIPMLIYGLLLLLVVLLCI
jgi:hypothetical protein